MMINYYFATIAIEVTICIVLIPLSKKPLKELGAVKSVLQGSIIRNKRLFQFFYKFPPNALIPEKLTNHYSLFR